MDRRAEKKLDSILSKISPTERLNAVDDKKLIYSVIGFIPACDGVDNGLLLSNLAYLIAQKGFNTCIVDFKVFYPNLYQFLDVVPNKKGEGLLKLLKSDKVDFREQITYTKYERLHLLSPSPQDRMEEYFDFEFEHIKRVITSLKNMYDVVLIDIPNIPPLEFCLASMEYCHIGVFTASERLEAMDNIIKLLDFATSIGISTAKFARVVLMNTNNLSFDLEVVKQLNLSIIANLPVVKGGVADSFEGKLYIKDNPFINKHFSMAIRNLADILTSQ